MKKLLNELKRFNRFIKKVYEPEPEPETLGDKLIDEIYTQIFNHKLQVVGDKIRAYYEAFQGVDLPEFLKPECEKIDVKVRKHLEDLVNQDKLDYFYELAIKENLNN